MNKIRIFLADDHAILREGLRHIISASPEYEIVGESGDGRDSLEQIERLKPDIVILDISMPTMTGIEISRYLKKYVPHLKIIILSQHNNEEYVKQLLKYGIDGYVLKENASDELLKAITEVLKKNIYLSPEITKKVVSNYMNFEKHTDHNELKFHFSLLSSREREILKLIAEGKSNNEIAVSLFISYQTVKTHRANIMKKLNFHKLSDLIRYAIRSGLIEP